MAADSLTIKIGVEGSQQASREIASVGKATEQAGKIAAASIQGWTLAGQAVSAFGAAAVAASVSTIAAVADLSAELNDLAKAADAAGTTASDLDTLAGALGLVTDGSVDAVRLLQSLDKQLGRSAMGSAEAAAGFKALGLEASDLAGMTGTGRIAAVADAMAALGSDSERAAVSAKLFEEAGRSMSAVWRTGGDTIRGAADQIRAQGVVSDAAAAKAEAFADASDLLKRRIGTLRRDALEPLILPLTVIIGHVTDAIDAFDGASGFGNAVARATAPLLSMVTALEVGAIRAEGFADKWRNLAASFVALQAGQYGTAISQLAAFGKDSEDTAAQVEQAYVRLFNRISELSNLSSRVTRDARGAATAVSRAAGAAGASASAPMLPEMAGDYDSQADALEWIAGIEADQHAARVAREMERLDLIEQRRVAELSAAEEAERIQRESLDRQLSAAQGFAQASATIWGTVAQAIVDSTRKGTKARRDALMAQWVMEKVAANAQLTIDSIQSISASASVGFPAAIPAVAAAVALAVANRIALNAAPAPNLVADAGFTSDDLRRAGFTGRQTVMMHDGETVLGPQASSDASRIADAMAQVRSRVEGSSMGGDPVVFVSIGGEQVEAVVTRMQADSIRRGDHTLPLALRDARL